MKIWKNYKVRFKAEIKPMKMTVLKKLEYKDYRIYIMQFLNIFQYLITDKHKNLYQDHLVIPPSLFNTIKHKLHLIPLPYSKEEVDAGIDMVMSGAVRSIDALIDGLEKESKELKEISEMANSKTKKMKLPKKFQNKCMWRAVTAEDGELAFQCLNHPDNIVRVPEGEKPFHDIKKEEATVVNEGDKSLSQNTDADHK